MSSEQIELARTRQANTANCPILLKLADRLLHLIGTYVPDASTRRAVAFRNYVAEWRSLLQVEQSAAGLATVADQILLDCERLLEKVHLDRADREAELLDLMRVLRDVLNALRGDARRFEAELLRSTSAMESMIQIQDIREIKRQLSREVQTLKQSIAKREEADAQQCAVLTAKVETLQQTLKTARTEAATDALTGLPNRRAFDVTLREWIARAARTSTAFTVAMVDLDDFRRINEQHGHQIGDRVIVAATEVLTSCLEEGDMAARWGGEEFAVLLGTGSTGDARSRLTAALNRISPSYEYEVAGEHRFVTFSFSAGVTAWADGDTPDTIVRRADKALATAKRLGKRRVEARSRSFLRALVS